MSDPPTDDGEITVARDYDQEAVVVETPNTEERLAPSAARTFAGMIDTGSSLPGMDFSGGDRLAQELRAAADDVEG